MSAALDASGFDMPQKKPLTETRRHGGTTTRRNGEVRTARAIFSGLSVRQSPAERDPASQGRALVVGYGNSLRGDDALGPLAVQAAAELPELAEVDALVVAQLTPELAELIARAERVVFVDAACTGPPGGAIARRLAPANEPHAAWGHRCDPEELLRVAAALYGRAAPAWLVSARGVEFALGEGLSPPAAAALPQLAAAIVEVLAADSGWSARGAARL